MKHALLLECYTLDIAGHLCSPINTSSCLSLLKYAFQWRGHGAVISIASDIRWSCYLSIISFTGRRSLPVILLFKRLLHCRQHKVNVCIDLRLYLFHVVYLSWLQVCNSWTKLRRMWLSYYHDEYSRFPKLCYVNLTVT